MMNKALGGVVLAVLAAGVVFYVLRSYRKMLPSGVARHCGLLPDERVRYMWLGEIDVDISMAQRVGTAALGLVTGALLGGLGIASVRALGITVLLTTRDRLVVVTEQQGGKVGRVYFGSPSEIQIRFGGPGSRRIQGGASVRVQLIASDGIPCEAILHHTAEPYLTQWLQTGRSTAAG